MADQTHFQLSAVPANTPYFDSLFDDFGIWQHADGTKPLPEHGYALDDATRGFLVCLALGKHEQANILFDFMFHARKGDEFYGFYDAGRQPIQFPASEDAKGQVVWAMGYAISQNFRAKEASKLITQLTPGLIAMQSIRGQAYALLGAVYGSDQALATALQQGIARRFNSLTTDWFWPEEQLTYANGIIPYALLRYAAARYDAPAERLGRQVLEFLEQCSTLHGRPEPIGYDGWFRRGEAQPAQNGQQAIDVTYMMLAWLAAYQLSADRVDLAAAQGWWRWFEGDNNAGAPMYDPVTLKAYDGINLSQAEHHNAAGINYHSGAESNICLLLAWHVLAARTVV